MINFDSAQDRVRIADEEQIIDIVLSDEVRHVDSSNEFAVEATQGGRVLILGLAKLKQPISREQAIRLAAHLVRVADPELVLFDWVLEDVLR